MISGPCLPEKSGNEPNPAPRQACCRSLEASQIPTGTRDTAHRLMGLVAQSDQDGTITKLEDDIRGVVEGAVLGQGLVQIVGTADMLWFMDVTSMIPGQLAWYFSSEHEAALVLFANRLLQVLMWPRSPDFCGPSPQDPSSQDSLHLQTVCQNKCNCRVAATCMCTKINCTNDAAFGGPFEHTTIVAFNNIFSLSRSVVVACSFYW